MFYPSFLVIALILREQSQYNCSNFNEVCHGKMDPTKLVPPGTNFLINENPWNLFFCKIRTLSEKFGPPLRDERT